MGALPGRAKNRRGLPVPDVFPRGFYRQGPHAVHHRCHRPRLLLQPLALLRPAALTAARSLHPGREPEFQGCSRRHGALGLSGRAAVQIATARASSPTRHGSSPSPEHPADPVRRGRWVREKLLAGRVPTCPITVDAQVPEDHTKTLRARVESVTSAPELLEVPLLDEPARPAVRNV